MMLHKYFFALLLNKLHDLSLMGSHSLMTSMIFKGFHEKQVISVLKTFGETKTTSNSRK